MSMPHLTKEDLDKGGEKFGFSVMGSSNLSKGEGNGEGKKERTTLPRHEHYTILLYSLISQLLH